MLIPKIVFTYFFYINTGWKHFILYKNFDEKISSLERDSFSWKQKKKIKFWLQFHGVYIKLNTKFEYFWNNKSREQVLFDLTSQYGVQKYFFIKTFNEMYFCEAIT
jgi:hypothetical protein